MTIVEALRDYLTSVQLNNLFSRLDFVTAVSKKYSINEKSIIPSDYCYNITNASFIADRYMNQPHFFISQGNGQYEYIGEKTSYTGEITRNGTVVGEWINGVCTMKEEKKLFRLKTMSD